MDLAFLLDIPWRFRPFYRDLLDEYSPFYDPNTTNECDILNAFTKIFSDYLYVYPTEKIITALINNTSSIYYSR